MISELRSKNQRLDVKESEQTQTKIRVKSTISMQRSYPLNSRENRVEQARLINQTLMKGWDKHQKQHFHKKKLQNERERSQDKKLVKGWKEFAEVREENFSSIENTPDNGGHMSKDRILKIKKQMKIIVDAATQVKRVNLSQNQRARGVSEADGVKQNDDALYQGLKKFNIIMQEKKQHFGFKSRQHQIPSIKKRIRDLKRLLDYRTDLDETVRNEKKKQIVELRKRLKNKENAERRQGKYKSVQFFQKKKLLRKKKQLKSKLQEFQENAETNTGKKEQLEAQLERVNENIFYIDNFPPTQKYVALFPSVETKEVVQRREQIRQKIKKTALIKERIKKNTHQEKQDQEQEKGEIQMEKDAFFDAQDDSGLVRRKKKKKVLISGDIEEEGQKLNKRYKKKKF